MTKKLDLRKFIEFWAQFYNDAIHPDKEFYNSYINDLSDEDFLNKLWLWKMGIHFNRRSNQRAVKLMKENVEVIRNFRKSRPSFNELHGFAKSIFLSGIIYRIFLIHICRPNDYPIFDQHVFRAFTFLTTGKIVKEAPKDMKDYLEYRKFVLWINKKYNLNLRDIDKALMAFGQFLTNPRKFLR